MASKPPCDICQDIWERKKKPPPCRTCVPDLHEENREAFEVYKMVSGQVITAGMGEVIDIQLSAIEIAMNRLRVENQDECFLKVVEIARYMIEKSKESKVNV